MLGIENRKKRVNIDKKYKLVEQLTIKNEYRNGSENYIKMIMKINIKSNIKMRKFKKENKMGKENTALSFLIVIHIKV